MTPVRFLLSVPPGRGRGDPDIAWHDRLEAIQGDRLSAWVADDADRISFVGGALFTGMTYLSFSCVLKIKSENFIATSAFMPVVTLLVQIPAAAIGLISLPPFDWHLLPAMLVAIVGVLMIIWGNRHA